MPRKMIEVRRSGARAWNDYEPPSVLTPILQVRDLFLFKFMYESVASLQVMYVVLTVEPT